MQLILDQAFKEKRGYRSNSSHQIAADTNIVITIRFQTALSVSPAGSGFQDFGVICTPCFPLFSWSVPSSGYLLICTLVFHSKACHRSIGNLICTLFYFDFPDLYKFFCHMRKARVQIIWSVPLVMSFFLICTCFEGVQIKNFEISQGTDHVICTLD